MAGFPGKKHWLRNTLIGLGVLLLVITGAVGIYAFTLAQTFDTKTHAIAKAFPDGNLRPPVTTGAAASAQNILLLGTDTRGSLTTDINAIRGQRSDTIMVVHVSADHKHVYVMSILRDSWVDIPGHGKAKVNAALSWGGIPLVVQTVESLISVRIDHVAIIDFQGFQGLTNVLGGVDVYNAIAFQSSEMPGHTFAQGVQRLNGAEALAYVRERHAFADGDFQRVRDQQAYLKAVIGKILSAQTLLDPGKVSGLVGSIAPYLQVDSGFNAAYLAGLAIDLRSLRSGDISYFTAPTAGTGTSADGQSIVNVDWAKLPVLQKAFRTDTLAGYKP